MNGVLRKMEIHRRKNHLDYASMNIENNIFSLFCFDILNVIDK